MSTAAFALPRDTPVVRATICSVVELGRQHGLAVGHQLLGLGIARQKLAHRMRVHHLGLEIDVGLLDLPDRLIHRRESPCNHYYKEL